MKVTSLDWPHKGSLYFFINRIISVLNLSIDRHELYRVTIENKKLSVLSIIKVLRHFNVRSFAVRATIDSLGSFSLPFIVHFLKGKEVVAIATKVDGKSITLISSTGKIHNMDLFSFREVWSGIVVTMERNSLIFNSITTKKSFRSIFYTSQYVLVSILILIAIFLDINVRNNYIYISIISINLIGVVIFVIQKGVSRSIQSYRLFCSDNSLKGCNSKELSFLAGSDISISDIGLLYFLFICTDLLLHPPHTNNVHSFEIIRIVQSFAALVSLCLFVYQMLLPKKLFCFLCLSAQIVIFGSFFLFYFLQNSSSKLNLSVFFESVFSLLIAVLGLVLLKSYLNLESKVLSISKEHHFWKNNVALFNACINDESRKINLKEIDDLTIGAKKASMNIFLVLNPYCTPCAETYKEARNLMFLYPLEVRLTLCFNGELSLEENKVALIIFFYSQVASKDSLFSAIDEWFYLKDCSKWSIGHMIDSIDTNAEMLLRTHIEWCETMHFKDNPMVFYNGVELYRLYQPKSLRNLLGDLYGV